ncbi:ATP-binding cassette domain-containing protein [Tissierella sp.]|uniref:ABC transporter ATP-binding protein n=1 Tax=Tissierella sp. TaxID=41274 RepID=UPI002859CC0D|nr:ATP-binding cassette domain-containing protein [Tissierella sp.]MDR7855347.1 ATP-binding cassette domain-containing protein [Tissierella sp.]
MEVRIENLRKSYDKKQILNIENLTIEKGKITGITGPNGCGKTTLLNIIAGLDEKYSGDISYDGSKLDKKIIDNMTIVFQKPYLFKRTVYGNIEYPLRIRGIDKSHRKSLVLNIIKSLEIEDLMEKKAHLLSGGESQKVALARALVFKPQLLLLDEPTSNIDPDSIKVLERQILSFNEETGGTVIIITHNIEQSTRLGHNVIQM